MAANAGGPVRIRAVDGSAHAQPGAIRKTIRHDERRRCMEDVHQQADHGREQNPVA
jgi:hypothetical protein